MKKEKIEDVDKLSKEVLLSTIIIGILIILLISLTSAAPYTRTNNYNAMGGIGSFAGGFFGETPGQFDRSMCEAGQDFVLQIAPFGCSPAVVRSDLLEEQNVPIYCQIAATQINPLVDVKAIDYMTFSGQTPPEVSGVGFHPNKAALGTGRSTTLDNYPILDNIGYAVIVLKKQPNESAMPDFVVGNLTAKIRYNIENAFGVGQAVYYLPLLNDNDFENKYKSYGFWDGRGFLKADNIEDDAATVSIYSGRTGNSGGLQSTNTVTLNKGQTSDKLYMTGFNYCLANLRLRLDDIAYPTTRARLKVNSDTYEAADGEKFLDGKCDVLNVEKYGFNEEVEIRCREDTNSGLFGSQAFRLKITPKVEIEINGEKRSYGLGDFVERTNDGKNNGIYIAYIGSEKNTGKREDLQVVLITTPEIVEKLDEDTVEEISTKLGPLYEDSTSTSYLFSGVADIAKVFTSYVYRIGRNVLTKESVDLLEFSDRSYDIKGINMKIIGFSGPINAQLNEQAQEYYQKSMDDYDEVLKSFASEKYKSVELGKDTFKKKINFAALMQQKRTVVELCEDFKEAYPDESGFFICENLAQLSSDTSSSRHVTINGKVKEISLDGIYEPSFEEYSIEGYVRQAGNSSAVPISISLRHNEIFYIDESAGEYIQLDEIKDEDNVNLIVKATALTNRETVRGVVSTGRLTFKKGITQVVGKYEINIQKIKIQRVAKVSVLPNIDYSGTETTFQFKVGIEKRSDLLKLSPEKAKEKIRSLDEDIKKWDSISSTLGKTVKVLKTACLATGALFTAENLLANLDGKGLARQKVMRNANGWYDQCKVLAKEGKYSSLQDCLFENSDKIDADVERYYKAQNAQSEIIAKIGKENIVNKGGLFSEDVVNSTALIKEYSANVKVALQGCAGTEITNPSKSGETIKTEEVSGALSFDIWTKNKNYNFEELRDIGLYCKILQDNPSDTTAKQKLYSLMLNVQKNSKGYAEAQTYADTLGVSSSQVRFVELGKTKPYNYLGLTYDKITLPDTIPLSSYGTSIYAQNLAGSSPIEMMYTNLGDKYILVLDDSAGGNNLPIKKTPDNKFMVFDQNGLLVENPPEELKGGIYFKKIDGSSYTNKYNNQEIRYFETEPFKGAPALVPIDTKEGWYVALSQTLPGFGNVRSFDESGRVYSYYLGNTGPNGNVDFFEGGGDDMYQLVVLGSKETFSKFAGLEDSKVTSLVRRAESAIADVQRAYPSVVGKANAQVDVPGVGPVKVGQPATNVPQVECEDFMSPQQCKILFNVCDPVICPSSRCDLGGAYPVADVIQSGIIGSIALCLPNVDEGIVMPVCLTGVQAGVDNLVSIKKSYRDCLSEQIETGKTVGICDEIQSIYLCELAWRQALPAAKIIVPTVIGSLLGQGTRGGGEYLGVANAWESAEKSVQYFTQIYGEDSFRAFKARSTDEVGGEVCKSFVSGVFPSSGNFLDSLTAPDSPPQFTGRFDEIPFTTATNPPVSQYKVFYHIFAGKDSGAYFRVYLKGSPGSSYYQDTAVSRVVAYGYIPKGEPKSDTVDFTAPSGYNQMCILVNGQEECGFKQVSTDFAVNYVQDKYLSEQAQDNVTTEAGCISGTPSLYSLVNPNIQEGANDVLNSELYNQGIYRICATDNPGQGTDGVIGTEDQRWVEVGYCGNQNLKCWLDRQSVKNVIKNSNIENDTLENVNARLQAELEAKGESPNFEDTITKIENEKDDFNKIKIINEVIGKFFFNYQKGWLLMMRGDVYGNLAFSIFKTENDKSVAAKESIDQFATDFGSPIFEFKDGTTDSNIHYRFLTTGWQWSIDEKMWIPPTETKVTGSSTSVSNENKAFLTALVGKSYVEGLAALIERTRENSEGGFFTGVGRLVGVSNTELSTEFVTLNNKGRFKYEKVTGVNRFFEYNTKSSNWTWSGGTGEFFNVPEIPSKYSNIEDDVKSAVKTLDGKDFINGAAVIFDIGYTAPQQISSAYCIKSTTKEIIFNVEQLLSEIKNNEDLNRWCSENGGTEVCDGKEGAFTALKNSATFECSPKVESTCTTTQECQKVVGNNVIQIVQKYKTENGINAEDDARVKEQTGAKNFECLILQQAYHESQLKHCKENQIDGNPLYCEGNIDNVLKSAGDEQSYGVMQINKKFWGEKPVLEDNVNEGLKILINGYNSQPREYICNGDTYSHWTRALRQYNGWSQLDSNINCNSGDKDYVQHIIDRRPIIEQLFPETCGEGATTTSTTTAAKTLLPLEIRVVVGNWMGDWGVGDFVYEWDGKNWSGGPSQLTIAKYAKSTGWEDGIDYISQRTSRENADGYFIRLELSCAEKELVLANKANLKSVDVKNIIKEKSLSLCGYSSGSTTTTTTDEIETEACPVPVSPDFSSNVLAVSTANARVLKAVEELNGEPAPGNNCFQPIETLYKNAGLGFSCVYPDQAGKQYIIDGETITIGVDKNQYGEIIHNVPATRNTCLVKNTISYSQKLDNILPGDQIDIVWSSNFGHAVIFVRWIDKANKRAEIFDWLDGVKGARIYRYAEMSLAEDEHPVYIHRRPVIV